jgi:hypothetical protein
MQSGSLAGILEGNVTSLGLLYTTLADGENRNMVPNNIVLSSAVLPLHEPTNVNLRARLRPGVKPSQVERLLQTGIKVPTKHVPHIELEEVAGETVIVRVAATPLNHADGSKLADQIIAVLSEVTGEGRDNLGTGEFKIIHEEMRDQEEQSRQGSLLDQGA